MSRWRWTWSLVKEEQVVFWEIYFFETDGTKNTFLLMLLIQGFECGKYRS